MKWYRALSGGFAGAIVIASCGILVISIFAVINAESAIPLDHVEDWMVHIIALIPVISIIMVANCVFLYFIFSDKKKIFFICILVGNAFCIVATLYFTATFGTLMQTPNATGDALFNTTQKLIAAQHAKNKTTNKWVPKWLDKVQKSSNSCCGVMTFRDWEQFWPAAPENIPQSCCKDPSSTTKCVTDFQKIPFPGTPSMYIKTDIGCTDEINDESMTGIRTSFTFMLIVSLLSIGAEVAYVIQFLYQYVLKKKNSEEPPILPIKKPDETKKGPGPGDDCVDPNPIQIDDSGSGSVVTGTPDLASSSVGSVGTVGSLDTNGSGAQANFGSSKGAVPPDISKLNKNSPLEEPPGSPNRLLKYGPSGVSGTIIGSYNSDLNTSAEPPPPAVAAAVVLASSSSGSEEEDPENKPKKRKKKKKKKKDETDAIFDEVHPEIATNSDDNLVGDRFPHPTQDTNGGSSSPRRTAGVKGKILGMTRNRKMN